MKDSIVPKAQYVRVFLREIKKSIAGIVIDLSFQKIIVCRKFFKPTTEDSSFFVRVVKIFFNKK